MKLNKTILLKKKKELKRESFEETIKNQKNKN